MIWTSSFGSNAPGQRKVCIAKVLPRGFRGFHLLGFAPSDPWAGGDWRARYLAEMKSRYPARESLLSAFAWIEARVRDPILCCYEADPSRCHRRILAEYAFQVSGLEIPEWGAQGSLLP